MKRKEKHFNQKEMKKRFKRLKRKWKIFKIGKKKKRLNTQKIGIPEEEKQNRNTIQENIPEM